jgi:hypothetical protein
LSKNPSTTAEIIDQEFGSNFRAKIQNYVANMELWNFVGEYEPIISQISNWELFRRAILASPEKESADLVTEITVNFDHEITMKSIQPLLSKLYQQLKDSQIRTSGHGIGTRSLVVRVYDPCSRIYAPKILKSMSTILNEFGVIDVVAKHADDRLEVVWKKE